MREHGQPPDDHLQLVTQMSDASHSGELMWVSEEEEMGADAGPPDQLVVVRSDDGQQEAQIVVLETGDGDQQVRLLTDGGSQLITLPPELASQLKEGLSSLTVEELADGQQLVEEDASSGLEGGQPEPGQDERLSVLQEGGGLELSYAQQAEEGSVGEEADILAEHDGALLENVREDENNSTEYLKEEIGDMLAENDQVETADVVESNPVGTVDVYSDAETSQNMSTEWTETAITTASGAQLQIRMPTAAALSGAAVQPSGARLRVVSTRQRDEERAARPAPPARSAVGAARLWSGRARRRASRGIQRAVAALKRAQDSDEFDEEEEEGEEPAPAPPPPPPPPPTTTTTTADGQPKRGRGRPRKTPRPETFACQLCRRSLNTQTEFFEHLREHYEAPGGDGEAAPAAAGSGDAAADAADGEQARQDSPAELNVDIIAAQTAEVECDQCGRRFLTEEDLERHAKVHVRRAAAGVPESDVAAESEGAERESAGQESAASEAGGQDAASKYEMKNLKSCEECIKVFTTASSLRNHVLRAHDGAGGGAGLSPAKLAQLEYECSQCHVTYTSQKVHERHLRLHEDQKLGRLPHGCSACSAAFLTSNLLKHHLQREHRQLCPTRQQGQGPRRRTGRPVGSSDKKRQAVYDLIRQLDDGVFSCSLCGQESKTKNHLFYHVSIKHKALEGHKCETCDKTFFTEGSLRVHERTHTGERPFGCEYCARRFRQHADLTSHVMSVHTLERPYRCRFCFKSFARKYSLTIHMRCHTNERNYKCPICNKGFRASTYLTGHMKIHTGERAHSCPICHKSFRMRSDMKRHLFTHSRDRPHQRSLRSLTVASETDGQVMLLDPAQLCNLQLVTDEDGETMVISGGVQIKDHPQTVIDERTGQMMVPEGEMAEYDETAMASMYLLAENEADPLTMT